MVGEDESKKRRRIGWNAAEFEVRLVKGLLLQLGEPGKAWSPPSPTLSLPYLHARTPTSGGRAARHPCVAGLVRDSGATKGPHNGQTGSTRLSALRPCPHQTSRAVRKCAGPSFDFWIDSQPISRISQPAPDHNLVSSTTQLFRYQPAVQTYNVHTTYGIQSSCPSSSLTIRFPQSKPPELSVYLSDCRQSQSRLEVGLR